MDAGGFLRLNEVDVAHILVVEDNPVVRMLAEQHVESAGHTVMTAADGREALLLAAAVRPDLILSDLDMPNLDGFGLIAALRARADLAGVPVIFLTAFDDMETFHRITQLGADDFVNKPINRTALLGAIDRCIALARQSTASGSARPS
ncbi:MAG: response regulator [Betaproteobacteria bacterium]|nr:response regulator [Betaproteobacteria bacterium]